MNPSYAHAYGGPGLSAECTVSGNYVPSDPLGKGRARVKTLIGREKLYSVSVYLCAGTGEIKG